MFQCSSASRKFLKKPPDARPEVLGGFQCSSASRKFLKCAGRRAVLSVRRVSVLFSEPKIPQSEEVAAAMKAQNVVSVLFSEPKIPQIKIIFDRESKDYGFSALQRAENSSKPHRRRRIRPSTQSFSALQRAENSSKLNATLNPARSTSFSALQRAENSSNCCRSRCENSAAAGVSVLFSEPKIPQINEQRAHPARDGWFQCSSASRKFLKLIASQTGTLSAFCFSALQRAENSSNFGASKHIRRRIRFQCSSASRKFLKFLSAWVAVAALRFQCSSASRKFLKRRSVHTMSNVVPCFSALQRAENSSNRAALAPDAPLIRGFSALQRAENSSKVFAASPPLPYARVSVLFSEPKIPQNDERRARGKDEIGFSALQRAENSSKRRNENRFAFAVPRFSALQRAENSSNPKGLRGRPANVQVSVLFSEPKIPQKTSSVR